MSNAMSYKGYSARLEYDDEDGIFTGRIAGIRDGVGFHATAQHEGMGLMGIKERVEAMGGTLTIESEVGKGTAIFVSLGSSPKT